MVEIVGDEDLTYFNEVADGSYEMYKGDPDDMTPEEHAEEEVSEWGR